VGPLSHRGVSRSPTVRGRPTARPPAEARISKRTLPGAAPSLVVDLPLPREPGCRLDLPHPDVTAPAEIAAVLADPTRAGILELLEAGPCCVCEMAAALGERPNNVSNHLARLREAGLVHASRHRADARWIYYERDAAACAAALAAIRGLLGPTADPHRETI